MLARHPPLNSSYNPFTQVNRIGTHAIQYTKLGSLFLPDAVGGNQGLAIFPGGTPVSKPMNCDGSATTDPVEQTVTAGSSSLQYDATTDTYTYVWKTEKRWAATCRVLFVTLNDGTEYPAYFRFTK